MTQLVHRSSLLTLIWWMVIALLGQTHLVPAPAEELAPQAGARFFREKIEPVLKAECYGCHSANAKELAGGLRLDSRRALLAGGDSGSIVAPRNAGQSLLIQALKHEAGLAMPPEKPKLSAQTIADFVKWVELGAPDPRPEIPALDDAASKNDPRQHWSFQPVGRVNPPATKNRSWVNSPVDAFVLAPLEQRGWLPAPDAGRAQWLRRISFDLLGLPPSPEEIAAFVDDSSPDAFERVVDRMLASPNYGERWAQHWLDVIRFAESEGYEYDRHLPDAWRFRDYLIASLNRDKPFDRLLREQIAGDEIEPSNAEFQTASIFHRIGPVRRNAGNPEIALSRNEVLTERTDIIGTAFLGLTIGCARCHNHKLEPISQQDYYRLQAYLAATSEHNIILASATEQQAWEARRKDVQHEIDELRAQAKQAEGAERDRLMAEANIWEEKLPLPLATIPSTRNDFQQLTPIHVLRRGEWEKKGQRVGPRPLSVLVSPDAPELAAEISNPRTQLARWLTDKSHPLTARVITNRLWQWHFGNGIVKTANDFGIQGDPPSHPELLDYLANALVDREWSLKDLHRRMVTSHTYRQSVDSPAAAEAAVSDPENRLLWRFNRRRLSAEELRDAMLAVAGRLNLRAGGQSVMVPIDPQLVNLLYKPSQWRVTPQAAEHDRRSIYLIAKRNLRLPFLEAFDAPSLQASCSCRQASTHAPQALELLNGRLSNDLAQAFAQRLAAESDGSPPQMVERAFWLVAGRSPSAHELVLSLEFLRESTLPEFALAMFNLNEFLYVP